MFPLSLLDFGELVVVEIVLRVHLHHLSLGGSPHDLDDLDEVIDAALPNEQRGSVQHLQNDTASRPDIYHGCVVGRPKDQLGSSIAS